MPALPVFIQSLLDPACYPHPADRVQVLETHISWVLLAGGFAYKIKKPVDFGFLDFSTLARRQFFCQEELRLNARLAPELYLGLSALGGDPVAPRVDGPGEPFEYAVKMRAFPQAQRLDRVLEAGGLLPAHLDALAETLAGFHRRAAVSPGKWGAPEQVYAPMLDNFRALAPLLAGEKARLDALQAWSRAEYERVRDLLVARQAGGFIRECHGDLHLENMALFNGQLVIFDGIEFSEALRWIDMADDLAFPLMDLDARGQPALAARLRNAYLEAGGDYAGARLLRFYQAYRAIVRAKVAALTSGRQAQAHAYLRLACAYTETPRPFLIATLGVSGAGKSTLTQPLLERLGALRLRADVTRKRLFGLLPLERGRPAIYSARASQRTYQALAQQAADLLAAGWPVIVDATCLRRSHRDLFHNVARQAGVPFALLYLQADPGTLHQRVRARQLAGTDASDADNQVLAGQLAGLEPPGEDERAYTLALDTRQAEDWAAIEAGLQAILKTGHRGQPAYSSL